MRTLIISIADSPATHDALAQGVTYGKTEIRRGAIEAYASLEFTNLLQHAGECILRLYLARDGQPCQREGAVPLVRPRRGGHNVVP